MAPELKLTPQAEAGLPASGEDDHVKLRGVSGKTALSMAGKLQPLSAKLPNSFTFGSRQPVALWPGLAFLAKVNAASCVGDVAVPVQAMPLQLWPSLQRFQVKPVRTSLTSAPVTVKRSPEGQLGQTAQTVTWSRVKTKPMLIFFMAYLSEKTGIKRRSCHGSRDGESLGLGPDRHSGPFQSPQACAGVNGPN
jgi:hypothetical protein